MATVLITDDAKFMRMQLSTILTKLGHEVVGEAENGREALEKFKQLSPDIVLMDITMPEVDGISAVQNIMKENPEAKIIMCSALGQQQTVLDAIKYGAKDFIVKPFTEDRIEEALKKVV